MAVLSVWMAVLLSVASGLDKHDPVVIGQTFIAGSEDPTGGSTGWSLTSHGISEKLFTVNKAGEVVPQVAESVKKLSTLSWEVTLKCYKFSDGTTVTAQHVADALNKLNEKNDAAKASLGTMTVTALDDLRLKIDSENPTPVMDAVLAEWVFVVYLEKNGKFLFTGPYAVETFTEGVDIKLVANPHYPQAVERPLITMKKYADGDALAVALKAGEIDMAFHLPVDELDDLRSQSGLTIKSFEVGYQYMMFHNAAKSPLSDVKVRKAVDLALDRSALSQELRGGEGTRSFFPSGTPYALEDTPHADASGAESLLQEAGYTKNGNGMFEKDGVPLSLNLVAYSQRPGLVIMQPVIAQTLTNLGIAVESITTPGDSWDQFDGILADKTYDLLMWAQHTMPAGDPSWFLNAFFHSSGGNNFAGADTTECDTLIDALATTETHTERVAATAAAHNAILEEVPVSILVTPSWHVGFSSRVSDYDPWGADYYVVRADFGLDATTLSDHVDCVYPDVDSTSGGNGLTLGGLAIASLWLLACAL